MADPRAIPALITLLDDRDMQTVAAAVEALSRMDAQEAVPALRHVVHRPEPTLKLAAIQALGRFRDQGAADTLIDALQYDELQFQLVVVEALAQLKNPLAIGPLAELVTHSNVTLRRSVINTLADMHHPDSIPGLHTAMGDPDPQLALTAAEALIEIGDYATLIDVLEAAKTLPQDDHHYLVERVRARKQAAVPALLTVISDPDNPPSIRRVAADALTEIGGQDAISNPAVVPRLLPLLNSAQPRLRRAAANALGRIRAEDAAPKLIAMLSAEKDLAVQHAVELALERIDTDAAINALQRWRSPGVTRRLPPLDEVRPTEPRPADAQPDWMPRPSFRSPSPRKETLFDDPVSDNIDLFSENDNRENDDAPRDWFDFEA
jgi:HEAT repeat protein